MRNWFSIWKKNTLNLIQQINFEAQIELNKTSISLNELNAVYDHIFLEKKAKTKCLAISLLNFHLLSNSYNKISKKNLFNRWKSATLSDKNKEIENKLKILELQLKNSFYKNKNTAITFLKKSIENLQKRMKFCSFIKIMMCENEKNKNRTLSLSPNIKNIYAGDNNTINEKNTPKSFKNFNFIGSGENKSRYLRG